MSSTFDRAAAHPVLACADAIEGALKETANVQVVFMDPADKRSALLRLARLDAQLTALRLRLMAASDDVALAEGEPGRGGHVDPPHPWRPRHQPA